MRLTTHKIEKQPNDRMVVKAEWRDRFRKPASVEVVVHRDTAMLDNVVADGDTKDVQGAIFGLAEIAWNMGWRPEGFINSLMGVVAGHKIPPHK